jgi:hypothetical protein
LRDLVKRTGSGSPATRICGSRGDASGHQRLHHGRLRQPRHGPDHRIAADRVLTRERIDFGKNPRTLKD